MILTCSNGNYSIPVGDIALPKLIISNCYNSAISVRLIWQF